MLSPFYLYGAKMTNKIIVSTLTRVATFDTTLLNDAGYDPNYTNVNSWTVPL